MILSDIKKLKALRALYPHDLALAKSTHKASFASEEEELKILALFHFSSCVTAAANEFLETCDDGPGLLQAVTILEGTAGGIVGCRTSGQVALADKAFRVGDDAKFTEYSKYRSPK